MFDNLSGLGYGLVTFAIILGVGSIVLYNFAGSVGNCPSGSSWNSTDNTCWNSTASVGSPSGEAYSSTSYLLGKLGTQSGGLAGWTPAVIAFSVGMMFLGAFFVKKGRRY